MTSSRHKRTNNAGRLGKIGRTNCVHNSKARCVVRCTEQTGGRSVHHTRYVTHQNGRLGPSLGSIPATRERRWREKESGGNNERQRAIHFTLPIARHQLECTCTPLIKFGWLDESTSGRLIDHHHHHHSGRRFLLLCTKNIATIRFDDDDHALPFSSLSVRSLVCNRTEIHFCFLTSFGQTVRTS